MADVKVSYRPTIIILRLALYIRQRRDNPTPRQRGVVFVGKVMGRCDGKRG
jgi:hypothetical protein